MNIHNETQRSRYSLEPIKWIIVVALLLVAIVGNYLLYDTILPLRVFTVLIFVAMATGVALFTKKGRVTIIFVREARAEVRNIIWPTRQETLDTTLIVVIVTAVISLILWGLDSILVHVVSLITGLT